jgi:hypothetical protein
METPKPAKMNRYLSESDWIQVNLTDGATGRISILADSSYHEVLHYIAARAGRQRQALRLFQNGVELSPGNCRLFNGMTIQVKFQTPPNAFVPSGSVMLPSTILMEPGNDT